MKKTLLKTILFIQLVVVFLYIPQAAAASTNKDIAEAVAIEGESSFGSIVSSAGDVNGDGYDDMLVGDSDSGYLLYGKASEITSGSVEDSLTTTVPITLSGRYFSLSEAGDVNGDGYDDIMLCNYSSNFSLIYGQEEEYTSLAPGNANYIDFELPDYPGPFTSTPEFLYCSASTAGDVNGDGYGDIIIGHVEDDAAYLIYGKSEKYTDMSLDDSTVATFSLTDGYSYGLTVSTAGDVNGDGYDDIIIGDMRAGDAYLVYGKSEKYEDTSLEDSSVAVFYDVDGRGAYSVSTAGDVNGDGYDDVLIGNEDSGQVYLVYGGTTKYTIVDLYELDRYPSVTSFIDGSGQMLGYDVSSAGDVNNDGYDDILLSGVAYTDTEYPTFYEGGAYLVYGKSAQYSSGDITDDYTSSEVVYFLDLTTDALFDYDSIGSSVSSAGDVNGDGYDEILIGAIRLDTAYLYYSHHTAVEEILGPPSTITGDEDGYYMIKFEDDSTMRVHGFPSYSGSKKTKVKYYSKRDVYVVYHPTFKSMIAVDGSTGEELDRMELFSKASSKGEVGKLVKVGKKKMLMIAAGKKSVSRFGVVRLGKSGADDVFVKKDVITLKGTTLKYGATPTVEKMSKNVYTISLKAAKGKTVQVQLKNPEGKLNLNKL